MSYLRYLCLPPQNGVQHKLCSVFRFVCLRLVSPMLPVITPSLSSNVYYFLIVCYITLSVQYYHLYNNTPIKTIVNAASNITYMTLIEAVIRGR
jgi:hypothetical protein